MSLNPSRRDFFRAAAATAMIAGTSKANALELKTPEKSAGKDKCQFRLGLASYTTRKFDLDTTLKMCKRLALENLSLKDMHLPMNLSAEQLSQTAQKVRSSGVNLYGCGVVYMKTAGDVEKAFEYAKNAGIGMIIGVPSHEFLDLTEEKIKKYDIRVAIHNHGPTDKLYQSPSSAYELIKKRDSRFGLCVDLGHTRRCGIDCAEEIRKVSDRVIDVHLKDVTEATEKGTTVEIGRGVIDMPKVLRTLREIDYQGIASFEFEKDSDDPLPGLAESVGYVRGALAVL